MARLGFSQKPQPPLTPRSLHSAYVQLKTGIGFLKSYFNLINKAKDSKCFGSCREKQTISHLLLDCELYSEERATLERVLEKEFKLPLKLGVLFGTKAGKQALGKFLESTGICTAKWYTNAGCIES